MNNNRFVKSLASGVVHLWTGYKSRNGDIRPYCGARLKFASESAVAYHEPVTCKRCLAVEEKERKDQK